METILEIKDVRKNFGKKEILKGISLSVKEGEIISVLGPSGCGKSTLLNIIAGILPLDGGSVSIGGRVVSSKNAMVAAEERNINMVFQDFALWPHMKARDNILYGLKIRKTEKAEMEERLGKLVSLLHLEGLMDQYPSELSGGQQQRVAIARALITKPAIVLLDEPLCNLDIQLRVEMRTEMAELFHSLKTTVFHVTHDPSEAFAMADRIVVMNGGVIDQLDTPRNCYMAPRTSMVAGLLGAGNCLEAGEADDVARMGSGNGRTDAGHETLGGTTAFHSADTEGAGLCTVRIGGGQLAGMCFFGKSGEETAAPLRQEPTGHSSRPVRLRFRPEDCIFRSEETENSIPIRVVMATFEGGVYRVKAETADGEDFCLLHSEFLPAGMAGCAEIPKEKLYVYEKDYS